MAKTSVDIDMDKLDRAREILGTATIRDTIDAAFREVIGVAAVRELVGLASYTLAQGHRIVEPGALELRLAASSGDVRHRVSLTLTGAERTVDHRRRLVCEVRVK
jgi:Arc/MetJ family transcription regulator